MVVVDDGAPQSAAATGQDGLALADPGVVPYMFDASVAACIEGPT